MNYIDNPAGLRVLTSLVDLINNSKEVEKVLDEINKARDEANKKIAVVGKIKDIVELRGKAAAALEEAEGALAKAKREADVILGQAGSTAAAEGARQKRADEIFAAAEDREKALDARASKLADGERELQGKMDAISGLKIDFNALFK